MSKRTEGIIKAIGVVLIFVGAFISLMLRKDLGNGAISKETIEIETVFEDKEIDKQTDKESVETVAQNPSDEIKLEIGKEVEAEERVGILLVNRNHPLPEEYEVELEWLSNGREQVAREIYDDLQAMLSEGKKQGLQFVVASGYRSVSEQQEIWDDTIRMWTRRGLSEEEAARETSKTLAYPGESEHATGLAVDIVSLHYQNLDDKQHDTEESTWLRKNCHKYGFILRYPEGKEEITGITYESWHFRYVGKEVATYIMEQGITLEEYKQQYNK